MKKVSKSFICELLDWDGRFQELVDLTYSAPQGTVEGKMHLYEFDGFVVLQGATPQLIRLLSKDRIKWTVNFVDSSEVKINWVVK